MKTYLDCIPCFFKQALYAARIAVDNEAIVKEVLDKVGKLTSKIPMDRSPPETGIEVYRIIREVTGVKAPFRALKSNSIRKAWHLYPSREEMLKTAKDPLETAVKLAINDYQVLVDKLESTKQILYLADNAGETVFDRLLIDAIGRPVIYAVRESPIINDATGEDAIASGLDEDSEIASSGYDAPGTLLGQCSESFLNYFQAADIIISKGQGNCETLSNEKRPICYLLKVKSPLVARDLRVNEGAIVVKYSLSKDAL